MAAPELRHTPPAAATFGVTRPGVPEVVVAAAPDRDGVGAAVGVTMTTLVTVEGPSLGLLVVVSGELLVEEVVDEVRRLLLLLLVVRLLLLLLLGRLDVVKRVDEKVDEEVGVGVGVGVVVLEEDDGGVVVVNGVDEGLAPLPVLTSVGVTVVPMVVKDVTTMTEGLLLLAPEPVPVTFSPSTQTSEPIATVPVDARMLGELIVKGSPTAAPVPSVLLNGVQVTALASVPLETPVR